jgi:folate-dependent phosphoribosylglycinamide formyltransferase PurN
MSGKQKKRLLVFASGTAVGGGSGFSGLVSAAKARTLSADIVGVVSQHAAGGVNVLAHALGVPFIHMPGPWNAAAYQAVVRRCSPDFIALSGWTRRTLGLDPRITFSIHPGPLPQFGGKGMFGHAVHAAVIEAFDRGEVQMSEVCMHFVTDEFDEGPIFFRVAVGIAPGDDAAALAKRVHATEAIFQPFVTERVLTGEISWDGRDPGSLRVPDAWTPL